MTCPKCRKKMVEVAFDTYQCPKCGYEYEDDNDDDYSDTFACDACGNPAYPDCKDGCPMYDD